MWPIRTQQRITSSSRFLRELDGQGSKVALICLGLLGCASHSGCHWDCTNALTAGQKSRAGGGRGRVHHARAARLAAASTTTIGQWIPQTTQELTSSMWRRRALPNRLQGDGVECSNVPLSIQGDGQTRLYHHHRHHRPERPRPPHSNGAARRHGRGSDGTPLPHPPM